MANANYNRDNGRERIRMQNGSRQIYSSTSSSSNVNMNIISLQNAGCWLYLQRFKGICHLCEHFIAHIIYEKCHRGTYHQHRIAVHARKFAMRKGIQPYLSQS